MVNWHRQIGFDLAEKYLFPYIESNTKDYSSLFKKGASNIVHNQAFNMENEYFARKGYKTKKAQKDIHKQSIVINSDKMLPYIQSKLIKERKVVKYQKNGKEVIRNNVRWSKEESEMLNKAIENNGNISEISISMSKRLGRSKSSTYQKLRKIEISNGTWIFRKV